MTCSTPGALAAIIVVLALAACTDQALLSTAPIQPTSASQVTIQRESCVDPDDPHCLPDDGGEDPSPTAPGYWIGPDYTMENCLAPNINDRDGDSVDDTCEYRIAKRFAPLLDFAGGEEDARRESYWAASFHHKDSYNEPRPEDCRTVSCYDDFRIKVMYMLAYHKDNGDDCPFGSGYPSWVCTEHYGDSEFIELKIKYDRKTEHWMLERGYLSAHFESLAVPRSSESVSYGELEYPDWPRGFPRIFVAENKHANYKSAEACDAGGYLGSDHCNGGNVPARVDVYEGRNVGSSDVWLINCVRSDSPSYYDGRECFWSSYSDFCGWYHRGNIDAYGGTCAQKAYGEVLGPFLY